jgi:hypothetical protein
MDELRYTLLSDGSTNKALIPILTWALRERLPHVPIQGEWADLRRLPKPPPRSRLDARIRLSVDLFPCDLLFVHRDAENARYQRRVSEINRAVDSARGSAEIPPTVCVIPVRMLETWLMFDEPAIRRAAGNPNGAARLSLPRFRDIESLASPKAELHRILKTASGLRGRRLGSFDPNNAVCRIPDYIEDFSPLRNLAAFQRLEEDVSSATRSLPANR